MNSSNTVKYVMNKSQNIYSNKLFQNLRFNWLDFISQSQFNPLRVQKVKLNLCHKTRNYWKD